MAILEHAAYRYPEASKGDLSLPKTKLKIFGEPVQKTYAQKPE